MKCKPFVSRLINCFFFSLPESLMMTLKSIKGLSLYTLIMQINLTFSRFKVSLAQSAFVIHPPIYPFYITYLGSGIRGSSLCDTSIGHLLGSLGKHQNSPNPDIWSNLRPNAVCLHWGLHLVRNPWKCPVGILIRGLNHLSWLLWM